jgi:hypothetical protein
VSAKDGGACVTWARTLQGDSALIAAAEGGHTACVEALVAAKAALDIQDVSYARLFACAVALICAFTCTKLNIVICNPVIISSLSYRSD